MRAWAKGSAMAVALAIAAAGAGAQEVSTNRVAVETDWAVYVHPPGDAAPEECWGVSAPKETVNTRDGNVVDVLRGDILLFVTFRPETGAAGEVMFYSGYPLADGSFVELEVGGQTFDLFTQNVPDEDGDPMGHAWPLPDDDGTLLTALKRGAEAVVTGVSTRGTTTRDTFSLMGFTAAMEDAERRCAQ